jgi:hypothetical protein
VTDAAPKAKQADLRERLRPLFTAPDAVTAQEGLSTFIARFEQIVPTAVAILEQGLADAIAV